jgi:cell division protein FtsL
MQVCPMRDQFRNAVKMTATVFTAGIIVIVRVEDVLYERMQVFVFHTVSLALSALYLFDRLLSVNLTVFSLHMDTILRIRMNCYLRKFAICGRIIVLNEGF